MESLSRGTDNADAERLRAVLDVDCAKIAEPLARPALLVLAGLPGTGKTYFAKCLLERLSFLVLETDRLRKELVPSPRYTATENRRLFDACHLLTKEYLAFGYPVLFDATNLTERFRTPLYQIAESLGRPVAAVEVTAPREVVCRRLRGREAGLDRETNSDAGWLIYCRMAPAWEPILQEHHLVDSSADISPVLEQVVSWASQSDSTGSKSTRGYST